MTFQQQLAAAMRESIGNRCADIRAKVEADRFQSLPWREQGDIEWMLGILEGLCEQSAAAADCECRFSCADDPRTACSLSGQWHVHPGEPCYVHPNAPGDLAPDDLAALTAEGKEATQ